MKTLIVGLGNPGKQYAQNRHNLGFMVVDGLEEIPQDFEILKPDTFMNLSGQAVVKKANFYKLNPDNIWVVHDELDLPFGTIRVNFGGSSAGHNGIQSVIEELGTDQFWRFRIGIGRPENLPADKYVLQDFSETEKQTLSQVIDLAVGAVIKSIAEGRPQEQTIKL